MSELGGLWSLETSLSGLSLEVFGVRTPDLEASDATYDIAAYNIEAPPWGRVLTISKIFTFKGRAYPQDKPG